VALKSVLSKAIARCRAKVTLQDATGLRGYKYGNEAVTYNVRLFDIAVNVGEILSPGK